MSADPQFPASRAAAWSAAFFFAYLYLPVAVLIALSFNANRSATHLDRLHLRLVRRGLRLNKTIHRRGAQLADRGADRPTIVATPSSPRWPHSAPSGAFRGQAPVNAGPIALPAGGARGGDRHRHHSAVLRHDPCPSSSPRDRRHRPYRVLHPLRLPADPRPARGHGPQPAREAAADLYADEWPDLPADHPAAAVARHPQRRACSPSSSRIDDFVITFFVAGAGASTLPIYIYTLIRTRHLARGQRHLGDDAGPVGCFRIGLAADRPPPAVSGSKGESISKTFDLGHRPTSIQAEEWEHRVKLAACYRVVDLLGWSEVVVKKPHLAARSRDRGAFPDQPLWADL